MANAGSSVASTVAAALPKSSEDVKSQLAAAHKEIAALKERVAEQTGLRQRKTGDSNPSGVGALQQQVLGQGQGSQEMAGVPVQIVAGLCLLSFLLAYFFF